MREILSKYQKALDRLFIHSIRSEDVKMLQELVDKEKPMPLLFVEEEISKNHIFRYRACYRCKKEINVLDRHKRCSECGGVIDWRDIEE